MARNEEAFIRVLTNQTIVGMLMLLDSQYIKDPEYELELYEKVDEAMGLDYPLLPIKTKEDVRDNAETLVTDPLTGKLVPENVLFNRDAEKREQVKKQKRLEKEEKERALFTKNEPEVEETPVNSVEPEDIEEETSDDPDYDPFEMLETSEEVQEEPIIEEEEVPTISSWDDIPSTETISTKVEPIKASDNELKDTVNDYLTVSEAIKEEGYSNELAVEQNFQTALDKTLDKSNICLQIDRQGNTYINPLGTVSRQEALKSILSEKTKGVLEIFSKLKEEQKDQIEKLSKLNLSTWDSYEEYTFSPSRLIGLTVKNPLYELSKKTLNLPVTRLEISYYLMLAGLLHAKTKNLPYIDMINTPILSQNGISLQNITSTNDPEVFISDVLNNKTFLYIADYILVSNMIIGANIDKKEIRVLERISRLDFMFIFDTYID